MTAIKDSLMPQLLQNFDNLETFVCKFGCHIYDLQTKTGCIKIPPRAIKILKELNADKPVPPAGTSEPEEPQPSTSGLSAQAPPKRRKPNKIYSDSDDEDDTENLQTPPSKPKVVQFKSPLTDVKGERKCLHKVSA